MNVVKRFLKRRKQSDNIKMICICILIIIILGTYIVGKYNEYSELIHKPYTLTLRSYKEIINPYDIENLKGLDNVTGVRLINEAGEETTIKEEAMMVEVTLSELGRQGKYAMKMQEMGWMLIDNYIVEQIHVTEENFYLELKYCVAIIFLLGFILRLYVKLENLHLKTS
ncbi:MAG: hypothetical protein IJD02_00455 [Lachnospiraceae bacterium]|nr:hypothetical protein [Lachnospiraceae bacterium]